MLTDFGAEHSFAAGGARLREHFGFSLNASAVHTVTLAHAHARSRCSPQVISRASAVESGHKHVLHARLNGAGTAWLPAHADALAQPRVLRANQHWDTFWAAQPIPAMHHN